MGTGILLGVLFNKSDHLYKKKCKSQLDTFMPSTTTRLARSATMTQSKMISFAELIQGRDASVRVTDNNEL